jgi:ribosomal protein L11 methyltransferase
MKYTRYTIETTTEAEDLISASLSEIGIEGIEIADSTPWSKEELDEIFVDEVPVNKDIPEGIAYVSFYLSEEDDTETILTEVKTALEDLRSFPGIPCGSLKVTSSDIADEDYLNSWKEYFHAFDIELKDGKTMRITPSWEEDASSTDTGDDTILIRMDPGTAFGTGAHETTKLCIKALDRYVSAGADILDLGTGSGILSIAAYKFGASHISGTDLDTNTIPAVEDNMEKNGLKEAGFRLIIGDVVTDAALRQELGQSHDIVVANILPVVLVPLTSVIRKLVRPGGIIIYSGILIEKAPEVRRALEDNGFSIIEQNDLGEWCALVAQA